MRKGLCVFLTTVLVLGGLLPGQNAFAQQQQQQQMAGESAGPASGGPRKQLATIIYAGLGGAVLGLSTLSFYGRPQDKLANIAIGFAVGVIVGTSVVTYNAATNPDEFYGPSGGDDRQSWRYRLDEDEMQSRVAAGAVGVELEPVSLSYAFEF
jgi:glycerol uptake facilitator-like aquaporin